MAFGRHIFYASSNMHNIPSGRKTDYYIGSFEGDHFNDEIFRTRIDRIKGRLKAQFGITGFTYYWQPTVEKPYKPLSPEQKYKRAVTKAYNKHKKRVNDIIQDNSLFVDYFIEKETVNYYNQIAILKERYNG